MSFFPGKSSSNPQAYTALDAMPAQGGIIFNDSLLAPKKPHVKYYFRPVLVIKLEI